MLSVPAAPEPMATAKRDMHADMKSTLIGAINRPTMQVNKTKDITLGFIKLKNELKSNAKLSLEFLAFILTWLNLLYFRKLFKSMEWWRR